VQVPLYCDVTTICYGTTDISRTRCDRSTVNLRRNRFGIDFIDSGAWFCFVNTIKHDVLSLAIYDRYSSATGLLKRPVGSGENFPSETTVDLHAKRDILITECVIETH